MVFNLHFNTILSFFFLIFLIIELYFLIPAVITQISNPVAELVIPIGNTNYRRKSRNGNTCSNCRNYNK